MASRLGLGSLRAAARLAPRRGVQPRGGHTVAAAGHSAAALSTTSAAARKAAPSVVPGLVAAAVASGVAVCASAVVWAAAAELADVAEQMYLAHRDPEDVYQFLVKALGEPGAKETKGTAELVWRAARACHALAAELEEGPRKQELTYEGYGYAERAVALDPDNFACHKWMAILISDVGDYEGLQEKLKHSYDIKTHFERAIELNPGDATSKHLLGLWCFTFADLPWYQRNLAASVITMPSSTYGEALAHFQQAEETDPGFYSKNCLALGKVHSRLGNKDEARRWLEKCLAMAAHNADDREAHEDAQKLLASL